MKTGNLKHLLHLFLIWCFLSLAVVPAMAQQYFFLPLDTRDGLSENNVKSIVQDHWGFMWFGTKNGLNRYDGISVKCYDVDDKVLQCGNHNVSALYEDAQHQLWVGTDKGVYIFDPASESFSFLNLKTANGITINNWIAQIKGDSYGNIWIIAPNQGAFRYDVAKKTLTLYHTSQRMGDYKNNPSCVCVRKNGEFWIGTDMGGLMRYNPATKKVTRIEDDKNRQSLMNMEIYTICDYGEWIAIADHEGKLMKYNPKTRELTEVNAPNVHYKLLRALLYDGTDLYVGTQNGLYIINEKMGKETHVEANTLHPYGLASNIIYSLYQDRNKGIWLGTIYNGVDYMPNQGVKL